MDEPFAIGRSIFHRLDVRAKLVAALVYCLVVAVVWQLAVLIPAVCVSLVLLAVAQLDGRRVIRRLLVINAFVGFLWLFLPWSVPGEAVARWGSIVVTYEGLLLAWRITLRCNAIAAAFLALLTTSRMVDLAHGLRALHVPETLVMILFFAVRYTQVIHDEYRRLLNAMRVRCFRPGTNWHTYRTYANLVGVLLLRSYDRSRRVYEAMVCRGFCGHFPHLDSGRLHGRDVLVAGAVIVVALIFGGLEWVLTGH